MSKVNKLYRTTLVLVGGLFAGPAFADSISPTSFTASIGVGDTATVHKTVTVSAGTAVTKADIVFLADTTGSMGSTIANVNAAAASILTATAGLGDIAWGVSEFKDNTDFGSPPPPSDGSYKRDSDISTSQAAATAGLSLWSAGGGGDTPEQFLHALTKVADTDSFRPGAEKIVVLFGDATAHDPGTGGETLATTIAKLQSKNIKVIAFDVGDLNGAGQATAVATATGGSYQLGLGVNPAGSVIAAITSAVNTYSSVCLDTSATPAGLTPTSVPLCYNGSFDRTVERTFEYDLSFKGDAPGDYVFNTTALVDGGTVATEADHITVGDGVVAVPEPMTLFVFGAGLLGMAGVRRRRAA